MVQCDETIELIDGSLHWSSSSRDTREEIWIHNLIEDNATEREEDVLPRLPSNLNISIEQFNTLKPLEILRETIKLLWFNSTAFLTVAVVFIFPVSVIFLSNVFVNQFKVQKLSPWFQWVAKSIGFMKGHFSRSGFYKLSKSLLSFVFCFPFHILQGYSSLFCSLNLCKQKASCRKTSYHDRDDLGTPCILLLVMVSINLIISLGVLST